MHQSELKTFHCKNKDCRFELCQTDGESLFFRINDFEYDSEISVERFPFPCPKCRRTSVWRREKPKKPNLH